MSASAESVPFKPGFDHSTDPAILADHFVEWSRLQSEHRAFRSDIAGDYDIWFFLHHDDIYGGLRDTDLFSSRSVRYLPSEAPPFIPEELDPPEHGKYRQILTRSFSPPSVAAMEPAVRERCRSLIDGFVDAGACDYARDFGFQLPTAVFLEMMGLDSARVDEFVRPAKTLLHTTDVEDPDSAIRAGAAFEIIAHLTEGLEAKRAYPGDDLLTVMLTGTVDGAPMSDDHLMSMAFLLYIAGLDTVANALSYSMRHLAREPDLRATLRSDPARWPSAIEEFLRYYSIISTSRIVTRDAEFAGCPMKAGDRAVFPTAAAGRDPKAFENADLFDPDREYNRHLGFGAGPHRCLGAHLARLELRVAMEEWHARIPDYEIADGADFDEHVGAVAGMNSLPLIWG